MLRVVALSWTDANGTESGYEIERRDDNTVGNPFVNVANLPANSVSFDDVVNAPGSYSWRIRPVRFGEFGPWSAVLSLEVSEPMVAVTDLTATPL